VSSDNYYLIRRYELTVPETYLHELYVVTMEFDSDDRESIPDQLSCRVFALLEEARDWCYSDEAGYTEYGVREML
jgi:hypothetical protein